MIVLRHSLNLFSTMYTIALKSGIRALLGHAKPDMAAGERKSDKLSPPGTKCLKPYIQKASYYIMTHFRPK